MTICSSDEPYRIGISDRNQMLVVDCPSAALSRSHPDDPHVADSGTADSTVDLEAHLAVPLVRRLRAVGLLHDYLESLLHQQWTAAPDAEEAEALGSVVLTLLKRCLHGDPSVTAIDPTTRQRVLRFVEQHLFDSGLRTRVVADSLSISVRSVQCVFAELATTPTAFILENRLKAAAEAFRDRQTFISVTDLAFELGFCDASYFARRFKARFGVSPSRYAYECSR
jgi:AraC-like DNA-binding protein